MEGDYIGNRRTKGKRWAIEYPDGSWQAMSCRTNGYGFESIRAEFSSSSRQEFELRLAAQGLGLRERRNVRLADNSNDVWTWTLEEL